MRCRLALHYLGPCLSLNRPRSRSQNFHIKYLECQWRYSVGHSEGHIGNHQIGFGVVLCTLILDDLELAYFKVIKLRVKYCENGDRHNDCVNES